MKMGSENLNVNLRHVQAAQAVWRVGSFAHAASVLGVVPSALSETIRQLEQAIGGPLFDRSLRPPRPTALGLGFLQDTAPLLEGMNAALLRARAHAGLGAGRLSVGASPSAITGLMGPALARFRARAPAITCHLHDDIAETLAQMVLDGALDLAVAGRARTTPDLRHTMLSSDPFGLACRSDHALAMMDDLTLDRIDPGEVISLSESTGTRQLLDNASGLPPALRATGLSAHSTIAQLCMIRAGIGVALMPRNAVMLFGDPRIRFVPVRDLALERRLYLLEPAGRAQSHVALAFRKDLMAVLSGAA